MTRDVASPAPEPAALPGPWRGVGSEIVRWLSTAWLTLNGWKVYGDWPAPEKAVLLAAPHTSNWDGVHMLAAAGYYRVKLRWMGKKSLTTGPFGGLVKALGCVPIDRAANNDVVKTMSEAFAATDRMILAIPPEGTRGLTQDWKSGFYHIARAADVPIIVTVLDYGSRTIRVAAVLYPGDDLEAEIALMKRYYRNAVGKNRAQFSGGA
ncbi:MAG: 1-acyl-sn-glycerol-3-phosphate acyltransferase [Caulobacter sp.]|nr:1-acyl-sn-glycerol-3-phosphate acyltransferase [Caulobacter sp.]